MKKQSLILISLVLLFVSCTGNNSYFDLDKKGIISCSNSYISAVMIEEIDGNFDFFYFELKDSSKGVKFFSIDKINNSFEITTKSDEKIDNFNFKLKPATKYKISNISNGDAAQSTIIITTNEQGIVIDADKLKCD